MEFAGPLAGGEDDEERSGNDNGEGGELKRRDGLAEKKPAKYEIKDGGKLDENAEIGRIVELEGPEIEDASQGINDAGENESYE